ncbi:SMC-Scp complex subunit ScpB [Garciella nitratireducens]|uniref:Segregation and condensation protein B n=1 Tax=Garciella nitratireducens DSM 15102 TaxID=1121911 RepID=A0A1T4JUJ7_9FIRM|nr:SMC-Scp complex subunit ScpB [Garciella nitratireducens]RBP45580.1 condensin subunit ScpB [Garciella nitratireducens]SJZ33821.1 segregation and condensation protein B [Garciella nitratireducens DSM 15102]
MEIKKKQAIIEGLLFAAGEAVSIKEIARILKQNVKETEKIIKEMQDLFNKEERGIQIKRIGEKYQLATKEEYYDYIKKIMIPKTSSGLSKAALETLAIIAYKQPVTRMEIESIRGVKCEKSIQTLMDKSLIKDVGRLDSPGKPILYGTTEDFLRYIGIESLDQLPNSEINLEEDGQIIE